MLYMLLLLTPPDESFVYGPYDPPAIAVAYRFGYTYVGAVDEYAYALQYKRGLELLRPQAQYLPALTEEGLEAMIQMQHQYCLAWNALVDALKEDYSVQFRRNRLLDLSKHLDPSLWAKCQMPVPSPRSYPWQTKQP